MILAGARISRPRVSGENQRTAVYTARRGISRTVELLWRHVRQTRSPRPRRRIEKRVWICGTFDANLRHSFDERSSSMFTDSRKLVYSSIEGTWNITISFFFCIVTNVVVRSFDFLELRISREIFCDIDRRDRQILQIRNNRCNE